MSTAIAQTIADQISAKIYHFDDNNNVVETIYEGEANKKLPFTPNYYGYWAKYNGMYSVSKNILLSWRINWELRQYKCMREGFLKHIRTQRNLLSNLRKQQKAQVEA